MKLPVQLAGLFASGAFIVTALPSFFQQVLPSQLSMSTSSNMELISGVSLAETLLFSLGGTVVAGIIGFMIGNILSKPSGKPKKAKSQPLGKKSAKFAKNVPVTGDETFLRDVETGTSTPNHGLLEPEITPDADLFPNS
jgi:hypothetical protein